MEGHNSCPTSVDVLHQALEAVKDRHVRYGDCTEQFADCSTLWTAYFRATGRADVRFSPKDVAVLNILQKISRDSNGKAHTDNWVDVAGYAALAAEVGSE